MVIGTLVVALVTAYWFGLRAGAWAGAATFGLCLVATFLPWLATAIHLMLAIALVAVSVVGARRERPTDAVLATRWVRGTLSRVTALVRSRRDKRR